MTENQTSETVTVAPNGTTITTLPHPTWDVKAYRAPDSTTSKVIAISPDRTLVRHRDKVADSQLALMADELAGSGPTKPYAGINVAAVMAGGK